MMKLALVLIFLILALERILNTFSRKEPEGKIRHAWLTYLLIFTYNCAIIIALFEFFKAKCINLFTSSIGLCITLLGVFLRRSAIKALGNDWSIHIKEVIGQKLVKCGPYKYIHHPYYLAVMLELTGISLFFNAYLAFVFTLAIQLPLLLVRIYLEEKVLIKRFGKEYILKVVK